MTAEAQETCEASDSPRAYLGRLEGLAELITAQGLQRPGSWRHPAACPACTW